MAKPSWKGKTRGGVIGYKIFIFILRNLGVKSAYLLLRFVVIYFIFFAPKASVSIFKYFRIAHSFNIFKSFISIFKSYYLFGQTIIDKIVVYAGIKNSFKYTLTGEEHLREIKKLNNGGILISAHLGSWDIAGYFLKRLDASINIVMYEAEHENIKNLLQDVMGEKNWNVIPIKNDFSHIFLINEALSKKEIVCIHGDRYVENSKVFRTDFFGKKAFMPAGPFKIASKLNAPYSFVHCVKDKSDHYQLYATPLENQDDATEIFDAYVANLEKTVKQYPYQWFNYYNFWSENISGATIN